MIVCPYPSSVLPASTTPARQANGTRAATAAGSRWHSFPVISAQAIRAIRLAMVIATSLLGLRKGMRASHDRSHVHPRPPNIPVDIRAEVRLEKREQLPSRPLVAPDQLETPEDRRDVVAGQRIDLDALDRDRTEPGMEVNDLSRDATSSEASSETARNAATSPDSCRNRQIFASRNPEFTATYQ